MMKNNKGFTLVEVLVAITIMGIITLISLPEVQQIQASNRNRKFESYAESLENSARLYVDSNNIDLFGYNDFGCVDISFNELKSNALVKDYRTNGISCDNSNTYVHVEKNNGVYDYKAFITCNKDGKLQYETAKPADVIKCGTSTGQSGNINLQILDSNSGKYEREKKVTIKISSVDGLAANLQVFYYVALNADGSNPVSGTDASVNFGNVVGVNEVSREITISGLNLTGNCYLVVNPIKVFDKKGGSYTENQISGALPLDNTPPTVTSYTWVKTGLLGTSRAIKISHSDADSGMAGGKVTYTVIDSDDTEKNGLLQSGDENLTRITFIASRIGKRMLFRVYDAAGNVTSFETVVPSDVS